MAKREHEFEYRFPKSRSKRLPEAVESARKLSGFQELEEGYQVKPTLEELESEAFEQLLGVSEKWKGAAFVLDGAEVGKDEFFAVLQEAKPPAEGEEKKPAAPEKPAAEEKKPAAAVEEKKPAAAVEEKKPAPPEKEPAKEKPPAAKEKPPAAKEKPPEPAAEKAGNGRGQAAPVSQEPAAREPGPKEPEGKRRGCGCCWLPPSLLALVASVIWFSC